VKRGEIWWAELPPPVGNRPVIILTRDAVLENIGSIVVALVTRTIRQLPTEVVLAAGRDYQSLVLRILDTSLPFRGTV